MQGGATVPDWVVETWIGLVGEERFYMTYGSSERVGLTIIRADDWRTHRGSVGRGFETEIRVLDAQGRDLPPGEIGEIYMRRPLDPGPSFAYVGAEPPPTTPDGFTSIGDLGRLDADGYLWIADRRVDMIVSGGANVFPAEVEAALSEHPKVRDVVVIGLPDAEWGHRVHAIVEPTDPADPPTRAELDAYPRSTRRRLQGAQGLRDRGAHAPQRSRQDQPQLPRRRTRLTRRSPSWRSLNAEPEIVPFSVQRTVEFRRGSSR